MAAFAALPAGRLEEADRREAGEHRDPEERGGLSLRESGCAVDEVAEASVADFLGGVLDIFSSGIDAAGGERRVALEHTGGFADVAGKALNEIGAGALLLAALFLQLVHGSGGHVLGGVSRLLELVARNIGRRSQSIARALLHFGPSISHLILQVLRGAGILALGKIRLGQVQIAHDSPFQVFGFREGLKAAVTTSSATSLSVSAMFCVMRLACPPRSASAALFAAASAADIVASLAASNPDCAASPAACFTPSLACPMTLASALVSGRAAAMIAPIAIPRPPISAALSPITGAPLQALSPPHPWPRLSCPSRWSGRARSCPLRHPCRS